MNRRSTDTWGHWIKDLTALITAITALVTALGALGFGFKNHERLDNHKAAIQENTKAIEQVDDKTGILGAVAGVPLPPVEVKK